MSQNLEAIACQHECCFLAQESATQNSLPARLKSVRLARIYNLM